MLTKAPISEEFLIKKEDKTPLLSQYGAMISRPDVLFGDRYGVSQGVFTYKKGPENREALAEIKNITTKNDVLQVVLYGSVPESIGSCRTVENALHKAREIVHNLFKRYRHDPDGESQSEEW